MVTSCYSQPDRGCVSREGLRFACSAGNASQGLEADQSKNRPGDLNGIGKSDETQGAPTRVKSEKR